MITRNETSRARSVYPGDEAEDFLSWLTKVMGELSPEQRTAARMTSHYSAGFAMIGIVYPSAPQAAQRGNNET